MIDVKKLEKAAAIAKNGLWNSKWQNAECEALVCQTIHNCMRNQNLYGNAFSWVLKNAYRNDYRTGTMNADGMTTLVNDGSLIVEPFSGGGASVPPDDVAKDAHCGENMVARVTEKLLDYVISTEATP